MSPISRVLQTARTRRAIFSSVVLPILMRSSRKLVPSCMSISKVRAPLPISLPDGGAKAVSALNRGGSHDGLSQSATGVLAATLEDAWQVAYEIAARAGGDPGYPGLFGPATCPAPSKPRRLAFLETKGWAAASGGGKAAMT